VIEEKDKKKDQRGGSSEFLGEDGGGDFCESRVGVGEKKKKGFGTLGRKNEIRGRTCGVT